jgi:hypothetical protein
LADHSSPKTRSSSYTETTFTDALIGHDLVPNQFQMRPQLAHFSEARHHAGQKRAESHDFVAANMGGAMFLFVGLVLVGGIAVLAGIAGIDWAIAWLVLLGIATMATCEPDDDCSGHEASPSHGTASAIEAS